MVLAGEKIGWNSRYACVDGYELLPGAVGNDNKCKVGGTSSMDGDSRCSYVSDLYRDCKLYCTAKKHLELVLTCSK